jgi:uncharacterized protein YndB with AHSA1/START domain
MRASHAIVIERPPEEVFAYLADVRHLPEWQTGIVELRADDEPRLGGRHVEVRSLLGKRIEATLEITAYEPPRRFDLEVVEGPLKLRVAHTLEPVDGGTRVEVDGEGDPGRLFRFAGPLLARAVEKQTRDDLARLKRLLERR